MGSRLPGGVMAWTVRFFRFHFYNNGHLSTKEVAGWDEEQSKSKERPHWIEAHGICKTHTRNLKKQRRLFRTILRTRTMKRRYETYVVWGQGIHVIL